MKKICLYLKNELSYLKNKTKGSSYSVFVALAFGKWFWQNPP